MTVLAYDYKTKTLAVDSQITDGDRRSFGRKFKVLSDGRVVAFAGDVIEGKKAIAAIERGDVPTLTMVALCSIVIFYPDTGRLLAYNESQEWEHIRKSDTWGSGGDFAIAALDAGVDAERAVKIACRRSTSCGGKVHVFRRVDANAGRDRA